MRTSFRLFALAAALLALAISLSCGGSTGTGSGGATGPWTYIALGDSLATGVGALQEGYVQRYRDYIQMDANTEVNLTDLGVPGWMSGDLDSALKNNTLGIRQVVASAQVLTFDIGGNDIRSARNSFISGTCGGSDNQDCLRTTVANFISNWDDIVTQLTTLRSTGNTIIRTMDIYDPFVAQDQASGNFPVLQTYLDQMNSHIATSAAANHIPMAQVHQAFNGASGIEDPVAKGLIAIDGLHPNDAGHKLIADLLRALGYSPLK